LALTLTRVFSRPESNYCSRPIERKDGRPVSDQLKSWLVGVVQQLRDLGVGLLQLFLVLLLARLLNRILCRWIRRRLADGSFPHDARTLLENGLSLGIALLAITLLLAFWGVTWTGLIAAMSVGTLVIALGFQSLLQSVVAGIFVLFEHPYAAGDQMRFSNQDFTGVVEEIGLRTTVLIDDRGSRIVVPNSFIFSNAVINLSPNRAARTTIVVTGIAHSPEDAKAFIAAALTDLPGLEIAPVITVRQRLSKMRAPKILGAIPALDRLAERLAKTIIERTTQAHLSWSGVLEPATRAELITDLETIFPGSRVHVRRW